MPCICESVPEINYVCWDCHVDQLMSIWCGQVCAAFVSAIQHGPHKSGRWYHTPMLYRMPWINTVQYSLVPLMVTATVYYLCSTVFRRGLKGTPGTVRGPLGAYFVLGCSQKHRRPIVCTKRHKKMGYVHHDLCLFLHNLATVRRLLLRPSTTASEHRRKAPINLSLF